MEYIRYKNSISYGNLFVAYTVVDTSGWTLPLSDHPSIVEHPDLFEIITGDIPEKIQYLIYES